MAQCTATACLTTPTIATPPAMVVPARIFFEGGYPEAHIAEYPPEPHEELRKVAAMGDGGHRTRYSSPPSSTIENTCLRNRPHEDVENMVRRFA